MDLSEAFRTLVEDIENSAHGCDLSKIKNFMSERFSSTSEREHFLKKTLTRKPIAWDSVKKSTWEKEEEQDSNKFIFVQGDIINTTMVSALGIAESEQDHACWMVLSPDCDCIRSRYVRVAPVFQVPLGKSEHSQRYSLALKFSNCKAFYIPLIKEEIDDGIRGYYADLEEP